MCPIAGMALKIDPETYYDGRRLMMVGIPERVLRAARRAGSLKFKDAGGGEEKIVYKGAWLIAWLDAQEAAGASA